MRFFIIWMITAILSVKKECAADPPAPPFRRDAKQRKRPHQRSTKRSCAPIG